LIELFLSSPSFDRLRRPSTTCGRFPDPWAGPRVHSHDWTSLGAFTGLIHAAPASSPSNRPLQRRLRPFRESPQTASSAGGRADDQTPGEDRAVLCNICESELATLERGRADMHGRPWERRQGHSDALRVLSE
jgi:hypothetical protein